MAFAPDYAKSPRFYVFLTGKDGDIHIQEFRTASASANTADKGRRRELLRIEHSRFENHNGGQLQFGPDGLLYAGTGDGGGGGDPFGNGQNVDTLLAKLLRIDPRKGSPYSVPADNPFAGPRRGRGEIYAYGLRNPWRFSFDRATGDLVIADVGQEAVEEVDFLRKGRAKGVNFGWNRFEGTQRYSRGSAGGHVPPVLQHTHAAGFCSITGGYIVRDPGLPQLRGRYVYGDFCDGRLRAARLTPTSASDRRLLGPTVRDLSSFGEDSSGRIYATSLDGPVYRLASK
jgi:glucose/arabinose dehydrogenase